MAYVKPKYLIIGIPNDPDVVGFKVYWAVPPDPVPYYTNAGVNIGLISKVQLPLPGMPNIDGELTIGVTAVDDVGNESDPVEGTFPFDFIPPSSPTGLNVSDA